MIEHTLNELTHQPMVNPLLKKATAFHNQGNITEAKKLYKQVLTKEPNNAHALHFIGLIASTLGQTDQARKNLEQSLRIKPNNASFHHNMAGFLSRLGDIPLSTHHFTEAIRLKPDYGEAYQALTESTSFHDEKLLVKIKNQINNGKLSDLQASYMHFACAKIEADSNNYDEAFQHYALGNKLKHAKFDSDLYHQQIEQQIDVFSQEFVAKRNEWGLYSHTPIFVLGMPRSGTTLTEQILSNHSSVFGAGEINDIALIARAITDTSNNKVAYPLSLKQIQHADIIGFGLEYASMLNKISSGESHVINKHPLNFKHIGLIFLMFPNARVIHTARDPLDTCLSCFFQNFSNGQEYSFNMENLGEFYNGYLRLMSHWKTIFPNRIYDLQYEDLVNKKEQVTRSLIQHCNLAWEENCLSHHISERPVITASKYQVRKPVYASSIKKWRNYESHLLKLIEKISVVSS